jgi:NADPH2 dehydrogenase
MAKLFDPLDISNTAVHLRNRVVMPPMNMDDAGPDGIATTDVVEHYVARAEGGVGLVIVAASYVREDGRLSPHQLGISGDHQLEGLRRLAHSIKEHGAAAAIQIHHAGGVAKPDNIGGPPIAPSAGAFPNVPRDLTTAEIHGLVEAFAAAAGRAKAVGFDAVELHGAHGFLLTQFLSPATNHRTDAYGGDLEDACVLLWSACKRFARRRVPITRSSFASTRRRIGPVASPSRTAAARPRHWPMPART